MELKYNIGAGPTTIEGFQNLDWGDDVSLIKCEDNSVDAIYSSHFLSYFDEYTAMSILTLWNKKLKPGGILKIAVPDFDGINIVYAREGIILTGPLFGKMESPSGTIYHRSCWNAPKMRAYLLAANFIHARKNTPTVDSDWYDIEDDSRAMYDGIAISLNFTAWK